MITKHKNLLGYMELTLGVIFLSVSLVLSKFLIGIFTIFLLLSIRFFISLIIFLIIPNSRSSFFNNHFLHLKDWLLLLGQGTSSALFNIFMLYGLKTSTAIVSGLLTSTTPAITMIFSFLLLREKITFSKLLSIFLAVFGIAIINTHGDFIIEHWNLGGNFLLILAVICGSLFAIFTKLLPAYITSLKMTVITNVVILAIYTPFALLELKNFGWNELSLPLWVIVIVYAIMASVLFPVFWIKGQCRISATTASLFIGIMPACTAILAMIFLGEKIYLIDIFGMLLIIFSIFFGTIEWKLNYAGRFNIMSFLARR